MLQKFAMVKYGVFVAKICKHALRASAVRDIWWSPLARQLLPPCQYPARVSFLENSREFFSNFTSRSRSRGIFISLFTLDLDFKAFSFHFSFSKWVNQIFIWQVISLKKRFIFHPHFLNFQYPLQQYTGLSFSWSVRLPSSMFTSHESKTAGRASS